MKVRICSQCGARNAENAWHCSECGNTLSVNSVVDVSDNSLPEPNEIFGELDKAKVLGSYCSNCGQELNTNANFCPRYGAKIQDDTPNEHQERNHEQTSIVCPKCLLRDKIEKVTSIVKSQTRTRKQTEWATEYYRDKNGKEQSYSYPLSYDVVEITDLAKRLSPPPKPQVRSFSSCLLILGVLWLCGGLPSTFMGVLSIVDNKDWSGLGGVIPLILGIIVFMAKNSHDNNERNRVAIEIPFWENAIKAWNRLYYCYRDDILLDAENIKNTCQPEDIIKFCYQQK